MVMVPIVEETHNLSQARPRVLRNLSRYSDLPTPRQLDGSPRVPVLRQLLPFSAIAVAMGIQIALTFLLSVKRDFPFAFFYLIAVFVVAWFGGYIQGVVACLLTMVALPLAVIPGF